LAPPEAPEAFLPPFIADFNRRFGRPPAVADAVWRRPPRDLAVVLSCRYQRVVARDNTVRLGPRCVQLRGPALMPACAWKSASCWMAGSWRSTRASSAAPHAPAGVFLLK